MYIDKERKKEKEKERKREKKEEKEGKELVFTQIIEHHVTLVSLLIKFRKPVTSIGP